MTHTPQKIGKLHIDYIREIAIAYWSKLNWREGAYPTCLQDAMKEHRDYLIRCQQERRKIVRESMPKCHDCFTPLCQNDIFHYQIRCRDCFHAKHESSRSAEPRIPKRKMLGMMM